MSDIKTQNQRAQRTPNRINAKKKTNKNNLKKPPKPYTKEAYHSNFRKSKIQKKTLKEAVWEKYLTYEGESYPLPHILEIIQEE